MDLERFWTKGMGVEFEPYHNCYLGSLTVCHALHDRPFYWLRERNQWSYHWLDPHDPSVPLEVLVDGLEKLAPGFEILHHEADSADEKGWYAITMYESEPNPRFETEANGNTIREAIIAAIEKLIGG